MENHCIFCSKDCKENNFEDNENLLKRFFTFLERYLKDCNSKAGEIVKKSTGFSFQSFLQSSKIKVCECCLKVLRLVCDLYHDLQTIHLLLNWQLCTFNNSILAGRTSKEIAEGSNKERFRNELIQNLSHKLENSYPRVILKDLKNKISMIKGTTKDNNLKRIKKSHPWVKRYRRILRKSLRFRSLNPQRFSRRKTSLQFELQGQVYNETEAFVKVKKEINVFEEDTQSFCLEPNVKNEASEENERALEDNSFSKSETFDTKKLVDFCRKQCKFKCPGLNCKAVFNEVYLLQLHWRDFHEQIDENKLEVEMILEGEPNGEFLKQEEKHFARIQIQTLKEEKFYICELKNCQRPFTSQDDLEMHKKLHGKFSCVICQITKEFLPELSLHEGTAHAGKKRTSILKCRRCPRAFSNMQTYLKHHSSHFTAKFQEESCPICRTFIHLGERDCGVYKFNYNLFKHVKKYHDLQMSCKRSKLSCNVDGCHAYFFNLGSLTLHFKIDHELSETKIRELRAAVNTCAECGKVFKSREFLQGHVYAHKNEKPFECEICKLKFSYRSGLRLHMNNCHAGQAKERSENRKIKTEENIISVEMDVQNECYSKNGPSTNKLKNGKLLKSGRWKCSFCPKIFANQKNLNRHAWSLHPSKVVRSNIVRRFKCPGQNCSKLFKEVPHLFQHWSEAHNSNKNQSSSKIIEILSFKFNPESKQFTNLPNSMQKPKIFARIQVNFPKEPVFICEGKSCKRWFYSEDDYKTHQKLHGSFTCAKCQISKDFLPDLSLHELNAHCENQLKCVRCGLLFSNVTSYMRHPSSAHFSLEFAEQTCPICKTYLILLTKGNYVEIRGKRVLHHVKLVHDLQLQNSGMKGIERVNCDVEGCSAYFMHRKSISTHIRKDHGLDSLEEQRIKEIGEARKVRVCEQCGKVFKGKAHFQIHLLSHSGPQSWDFCCQLCSKKCLNEHKLKEHMRVHTKDRPFVCEVCGVKYAHRHNLRIHLNNKHGTDLQDISRKYTQRNITSGRKGKRKGDELLNETGKKKRRKRI